MSKVKDFKPPKSLSGLADSFGGVGFQATELYNACQVLRRMRKDSCTIFLTFTSNMVTSGLRGLFAKACEKKFCNVIITSIGSVEEDVMKSICPEGFRLASFNEDDVALRKKGCNRVGNLIIENKAYIELEKFLVPLFKEMFEERKKTGKIYAPFEFCRLLGLKLRDKNSFLYQCAKNNIPVFCPAVTDGAIGLQTFFFKQSHKDFVIDATGDLVPLSKIVLNAGKTGGIILGGGVAKHHAIGVNILREGFDYAVYVTTASEFDGSLSGAHPKEAVSWGKIKEKINTALVYCDATIAVPILFSGAGIE